MLAQLGADGPTQHSVAVTAWSSNPCRGEPGWGLFKALQLGLAMSQTATNSPKHCTRPPRRDPTVGSG
jgi:hypothetical protein